MEGARGSCPSRDPAGEPKGRGTQAVTTRRTKGTCGGSNRLGEQDTAKENSQTTGVSMRLALV